MGQRVAVKPYVPICIPVLGVIALLWVGFMKASTCAEETGDWIREEGLRIPGVTSSSTLVLPDGTYRTYYLSSEGITTATSSDGLTWSSGISTGIRPNMSLSEAFIRNPAVIQTATGDYLMIYEGVNSTSPMPGPETVSRFFRATSADGITFTKQPGSLQDGAVMESSPEEENFISVPDLIFLDSSTLRLYYVGDAQPSRIFSATSTDLGVTWTKEGEVPISSATNSIVVDPDIIQLPDGTYRLFFASPPEGESVGRMRIRSALATDGRNFVQEEGARVVPEVSDGVLVDPDVVLISATTDQYRMYFGETASSSQSFDLKSAVSPQGVTLPDLTGEFTRLTRRSLDSLDLLGFTLAVQNNGIATTEGSFGVDFYLSADETLDDADVFLTSLSVSDLLDAGGEAELSGRSRVSGSTSGQFVLAVVDANEEVVEADEGDNVVAAEVP
jgi:hypothetical protein